MAWHVLCLGHSLGGGVAALVTLLCQLPGGSPKGLSSVRCICHGPAAVLSKELADACKDYIVSVVLGCDPIPRLRWACNYLHSHVETKLSLAHVQASCLIAPANTRLCLYMGTM